MGRHKEKKSKKEKQKTKKKSRRYSTSSSSSSSDEWVEKQSSPTAAGTSGSVSPHEEPSGIARDEWMSLPTSFTSSSHLDKRLERETQKRLEKERDAYNPSQNVRELNPYWRDGGDGLPKFKKPSDDTPYPVTRSEYKPTGSSNWRKKPPESSKSADLDVQQENRASASSSGALSDSDMNALAAKVLKAEIMGDTALAEELKQKLESARQLRQNDSAEHEVILTQTDSKGHVRPLKMQSDYGEHSGSKRKKQKVETHSGGERVRYFPDDDKYSLKQMFENEKYKSYEDSNREFIEMAGKIRKNDDLDDVFTDNIRKKESAEKTNKRNVDKAISEHREAMQAIDNCPNCLQSEKMLKHLMVSMNENVYLSLPAYEPLTEGHCLLVPVRHASSSTHLDENEWSEMMSFRRALTNMFSAKDEDVIFFETAMFLHRHPHMTLHCVPVARNQGDMAPIYFKKAIDESEMEWASNKKLVSLAGRDVRRAIPKGLPYFAVSFGMEEGFAHVIEDQRLFPINFAQEIIGGILDLHHSKWRKPKLQKFDEQKQRVLEFSKEWSKYDCTTK